MCCAASRTTDITHVEAASIRSPTPRPIETELMLADLESLESAAPSSAKAATGKDKEATPSADDGAFAQAAAGRQAGAPAAEGIAAEDLKILRRA
jgi:ribosome-binding ATPase YchF (GTP1/OBG family)